MAVSKLAFTSIAVSLLALGAAAHGQTGVNPRGAQSPARPATPPRTAAPQAMGTRIAVLDVKHVFDNHASFKDQMASIEGEVKALEDSMKQMQQYVSKQQDTLKTLKPGTPEYSQIEAALAKHISDFRVNEALKKKNILEREAQIYYQTYQDILTAVTSVCQRYQIQLVVRYDSREMDPLNRGSVLSAVNRDVVYQAKIDITPQVLTAVNSGG